MYVRNLLGCGCKFGADQRVEFDCSSCDEWQKRQAQGCKATYDVGQVPPPPFAIGLTRESDHLVEASRFDRQFYSSLDEYFQRYGLYCRNVASLASCRRHLSGIGKALQKNKPAEAIDEAQRAAAVVVATAATPEERAAANAVIHVSESVNNAVVSVVVTKNSKDGNKKNAAKAINRGLNALQKNNLQKAGEEFVNAGVDLAAKNGNGAEKDAVALVNLGDALKNASQNIAQTQDALSNTRSVLAEHEATVTTAENSFTIEQAKNSIEQETAAVVENSSLTSVPNSIAAVGNGVAVNGVAARNNGAAVVAARNNNVSVRELVNNQQHEPVLVNVVRELNQEGAAVVSEPSLAPNNKAITNSLRPPTPPTLPAEREKQQVEKEQLQYFAPGPTSGGCGGPMYVTALQAQRHQRAIRGIYDRYANVTCDPCVRDGGASGNGVRNAYQE